jgi:hypothetical protein
MTNIDSWIKSEACVLSATLHRYGCGYIAALIPEDEPHWFGRMTTDSGSEPQNFAFFLRDCNPPVPVVRAETLAGALAALEAKLSTLPKNARTWGSLHGLMAASGNCHAPQSYDVGSERVFLSHGTPITRQQCEIDIEYRYAAASIAEAQAGAKK